MPYSCGFALCRSFEKKSWFFLRTVKRKRFSYLIRIFVARAVHIYNESRQEGAVMKKIKCYVTIDEWRLIIYALNSLRNDLIAEGRCTDAVDDALRMAMRAKAKHVKVAV